MRLVEPWIKVENFDGVKIMKRIERACRTCYRSEDKISEESYKNLLTNCLNKNMRKLKTIYTSQNLKMDIFKNLVNMKKNMCQNGMNNILVIKMESNKLFKKCRKL